MTAHSGPGELLVVSVPNSTPQNILAALQDVTTTDIRLLDLVIVARSTDDVIEVLELEDLGDEILITDLELSGSGLTGQEDLDVIASGLAPGSSALVVVIEHVWAAGFAASVAGVGGGIVATEWIPASAIEELHATAAPGN